MHRVSVTYRVRVYARGVYAWGEAIEAVRVSVRRGALVNPARRRALREALRRARERFPWGISFEAEIIPAG